MITRISGHYAPFILAHVKGCWVGLWPNNHTVHDTMKFSFCFPYSKCDKKEGQEGVTWMMLRVSDWRFGRSPKSFLLIPLLEVCQEWGVKKGGTLRTFRVADQRHRQYFRNGDKEGGGGLGGQ